MVEQIITGLLLFVAVTQFLPIVGFSGAGRLQAIYGIEINDGSLEILMRHRAMLFGILGAFLGYAAFVPVLQPIAFIAAAVSLASFLFLAATVDGGNAAIRKLVIGDIVAVVGLAGAAVLFLVGR